MELLITNNALRPSSRSEEITSTGSPDTSFIEANTVKSSLDELKNKHIIPVFIKEKDPLISHGDFVDVMMGSVQDFYHSETVLQPNIRLSGPVRDSIPNAKSKPGNELLDQDKLLYYKRMAFIIEIPSVYDEIENSRLQLMVGGVKSYNLDNTYTKNGSCEHFKIFIGYRNTICNNLCISTDGLTNDLKVGSKGQLKAAINSMIDNYNANYHLHSMRQLTKHNLRDEQFALLIGRMRMYPFLPRNIQTDIPPLFLDESQISSVSKDYFKDGNFSRGDDGAISLWRLYNLLTGSNKSSYIDSFIERNANAFHFAERIKHGLTGKDNCWFLS